MHDFRGKQKPIHMIVEMHRNIVGSSAVVKNPVTTLNRKITYMQTGIAFVNKFIVDKSKSIGHDEMFR